MAKITQHKEKIWSLKTADKKFSEHIRARDKRCVRCGRGDRQLQCSHFWDRRWFSTRFSAENCDTLCSWCHTFDKDNWEKDRLGEYEAFKIKQLGRKRFEALKTKHFTQIKRRDAILGVMKLLKVAKNNY